MPGSSRATCPVSLGSEGGNEHAVEQQEAARADAS